MKPKLQPTDLDFFDEPELNDTPAEERKTPCRPSAINSSIDEENRLVADPQTPVARKKLAEKVLATYAEGCKTITDPDLMDDPQWAHLEGVGAVLRKHNVFLGLEPSRPQLPRPESYIQSTLEAEKALFTYPETPPERRQLAQRAIEIYSTTFRLWKSDEALRRWLDETARYYIRYYIKTECHIILEPVERVEPAEVK